MFSKGALTRLTEVLPMDSGGLMMLQMHDFNQMTLKELRTYVLNHRGDNEALQLYMDRLSDDPNVTHYSGGPEELPQLEQLIRDHAAKERP